jgi:hypothetical protein
VSVGQRRRRPGWAPRRWDAGSPRTSARASGRARVVISTLAAASAGVDVGDRTGLTSHGVLGTHAMTWAWSIRGANWSQLACLRPPRDADHAAKVPGQQWVAAARADRDDQKIGRSGAVWLITGPPGRRI